MKSLKAAAVVAGSLAVAGFAAPAVALDGAGVRPADLNRTVSNVADGINVGGKDATDLVRTNNLLKPNTVQKATGGLTTQGNGQLLG
ncbi:hypothetical protein [Streptomyces sp. TRM68367]|uniref:hypothetical protein n=1 Tax=Streptomyces sp. TRM68367 TaxID=2758415 RepID=UPI00165C33DE|nr:hypothetical protein [Streptomyces sp. TRM68367]MBC9725137.1 hypothetical protein [Streptomyces sp. TRM68367]